MSRRKPPKKFVPLFEEESPETGTPSNPPEARLVRLLHEYHFPSGDCRKEITTSVGITTWPDWVHEPTKVAVYLDGMSRGLHGDPNVARRDQIIRQAVELDGYKVIVVQSRDLDDPQAVRLHLRSKPCSNFPLIASAIPMRTSAWQQVKRRA